MLEHASAFSCKVRKDTQWYMAQEGDATMMPIASQPGQKTNSYKLSPPAGKHLHKITYFHTPF